MKSFEGKWRTSAVPDEPLDARPVIALDANRDAVHLATMGRQVSL
jgi:hypothetical protein